MITKKELLEQIVYLDQRIEAIEWDLVNIKDDIKIKAKKTTKKAK